MKKLRSILSVTAFTLAITGAFASEFLVVDPGYARKADVIAQGGVQVANCKYIKDCRGGPVLCKANFVSENGVPVNNIQLYKVQSTCTMQLFCP